MPTEPTPETPAGEAHGVTSTNGKTDEEKSLTQILAEYNAACEAEFVGVTETTDEEEVAKATKAVLRKAIPTAGATLAYLSEYAKSETVRVSAAKYIIDNGLGKTGLSRDADPMDALLKKLLANDDNDNED